MMPPQVVEVEIGTTCNLSCTYCPNSILPRPKAQWIDPKLFLNLLRQLAEIGFVGRFSFHFYNEPLLHRGLEELVRAVREQLPQARPVLYSNGTGLTDQRYSALLEAGIDMFVITLHDGTDPQPLRSQQILLTPQQLLLTNRGGLLERPLVPLRRSCYAPMEMLIVTCCGEVLQCFEDARKRRVMGNLREQPLQQIWSSPAFVAVRRDLAAGRRDKVPELCALCDNRDYPTPGLTEDETYNA